jgi:phosphoribosylcarboxyaminoimidazole (NCAIR) mutase
MNWVFVALAYNVYMPVKGIPYNHKYFDHLSELYPIVEMTRNSKGIGKYLASFICKRFL